MTCLQLIELRSDAATCTLAPQFGGAVLDWTVAGQALFRSTPADRRAALSPLDFACFPMVPWSNRIADAKFDYHGEAVRLRPNFPPEPHAIHGTGWEDAWIAIDQTESSATLRLHHAADRRWPWSFHAEQRFALGAPGLTICLSVTNTSERTQPLAFGLHPYFDSAGARLSMQADLVWENDARHLPGVCKQPTGPFLFDGSAPIAGRAVDNCYTGWDGYARIEWAGRALALEITTTMTAAVIYVPSIGNSFCFEPVPHLTDALNRPKAPAPMPQVAPGETIQTEVRFAAVANIKPRRV
jgi:aldose 1-epimerase